MSLPIPRDDSAVSAPRMCVLSLWASAVLGQGGSITHPVSFLPPYSYSYWTWRLSMSRRGAFGCGQYTCMRSDWDRDVLVSGVTHMTSAGTSFT